MHPNPRAAPELVIFISSGATNLRRRQSLRNSWFRYLCDPGGPVPAHRKVATTVLFAIAKPQPGASAQGGGGGNERASPLAAQLEEEQAQHHDIVLLDAPEGYEHLWRKALVFFQWLASSGRRLPDYVMHADDDSFLRLDLLLPLLDAWPRTRHYWGYIWDQSTPARSTAPIRNPANKSHMPSHQYPLDSYPPFASGCGYALSADLVAALVAAAPSLPDYRLLDPPFGIHLCGPPAEGRLVVQPPVVPVHEPRVRPYRPLPTFRPDTLVQHYLKPEEMRPFYLQALESARREASSAGAQPPCADQQHAGSGQQQALAPATDASAKPPAEAVTSSAPEQLYDLLVGMGLLRR